jgi:DNA gyrase subunit A
MGVKFVSPKPGDAVAVVARSVEAREDEEAEDGEPNGEPDAVESSDPVSDATIEGTGEEPTPDADGESES